MKIESSRGRRISSFSSFRLPPSSFPLVPLAVPCWNGSTYRSIVNCLVTGNVVNGPDLGKLRAALSENLRVADVLLCGSGSLALEMALRACGVGPRDEVVIPTFCCSALVPPIIALGAVPVLADVGAELNMTAETVEAALGKKTKAIIVPHLFGNPADIRSIAELAKAKNIFLIDDDAQALGATIEGRPVGTFGDVGIISFGREKFALASAAALLLSQTMILTRVWIKTPWQRRRLRQRCKVQNDFDISQSDAFATPGSHPGFADSSI